MSTRQIEERFKKLYSNYKNICLLCTEPTAEQCHRRLVAECLQKHCDNIEIIHI